MRYQPFALGVFVVVAVGLTACGSVSKVGFSNIRAKEWRQARATGPSDAIANADDSCEREGSKTPDPTPNRVYPCPGESRMLHLGGAQASLRRR